MQKGHAETPGKSLLDLSRRWREASSPTSNLLLLSTEQTSDGDGTGGHNSVCGLPGLHARNQRERAALRGRGQPGREIHEEEDLQVGLRKTVSVTAGLK